MSFFDEGDEPRTQQTRAQRPRRPAPRPGGGGGDGTDHQQVLVRRAVAAGAGVVFILLVVVLLRGCLESRQENALKDYNRDVTSVAQQSAETFTSFFETLTQGDVSPVEQSTQLNQLRIEAQKHVDDAAGFSVPGALEQAQTNMLLALQFREEAIEKVAQKIPSARGSERGSAEEATAQIAGQMEKLLASDVVWSQRVEPFVKQALDEQEIGGQSISRSAVLTSVTWLNAETVAGRIGGQAAADSGGGGSANTAVAPGLHGHGLTGVTVGDATLTAGQANRIPATSNPTFTVKFANQGENDENDVKVRVTVKPQSGKSITATKTVDQTKAGAEAEVAVPLGQAPPIGQPATVTVEVLKVGGEEKVDNNKQEFTALFTRA